MYYCSGKYACMAIKEQTVSGVKWNTAATITNAGIQVLKLFILARLLEKTDFGLIAIAMMVIGFTEIFSNLGLSIGLIHKQDITQKQYSSVYWVNLIASVLLYGVLWAITPLLVRFYTEPELASIIPQLGLLLIINAFGKIFYTFKTKELEFKFISIVNIVCVVAGAILTVLLALWGFGVYCLVYGMLFQALAMQLTYAISGFGKYKILFYCKLKDIADYLKIGGFQVGTQVLDYAAAKLDIFLIGRFFGMELLGIYNLAKELILRIIHIINPIITNVATPAFAKIQDNVPLMQNTYLRILKLLSSLNFPIFFLFFVFAEPITLLVYGEKMMGVALFLRILSMWGLLNSVGNPAGILMVSLGRTDLGFYWALIRISATTAAILIASYISLEAVAYAQVILAFIFFFIYWRTMIYNMVQIKLKDYIGANARPFLYALAAAIIAAPLCLIFPIYVPDCVSQFEIIYPRFYAQAAALILFGLTYTGLYWFCDREYVKEQLHLLMPNRWQRQQKIE